jgi:hypothetical protein
MQEQEQLKVSAQLSLRGAEKVKNQFFSQVTGMEAFHKALPKSGRTRIHLWSAQGFEFNRMVRVWIKIA